MGCVVCDVGSGCCVSWWRVDLDVILLVAKARREDDLRFHRFQVLVFLLVAFWLWLLSWWVFLFWLFFIDCFLDIRKESSTIRMGFGVDVYQGVRVCVCVCVSMYVRVRVRVRACLCCVVCIVLYNGMYVVSLCGIARFLFVLLCVCGYSFFPFPFATRLDST